MSEKKREIGTSPYGGNEARKRETRVREASGIVNGRKREAIVSGAHTGVGLDSFIGRDRESGRKRGRKRDF